MPVTLEPPLTASNNSPGRDLSVEELQGPGFRFVRSFLLLILLLVGLLITLAGLLSWHFSMDVTVQGKGVIEPQYRHWVKAEISGIIKEIYVHSGQQVKPGDLLASLDDTDRRVEWKKIQSDLEINQSRVRELERQIDQERRLREIEVAQAQLEVNRARVQREKVIAEQQIYSRAGNLKARWSRKPLADLLPVRVANALLMQSEGLLALALQRLAAVDGRRQEIQALGKRREQLDHDRALMKYRLEQSTIRAPAAGTVLTGDLRRRVGDRLQAGEAILEIAEMQKWQAKVRVKEIDLPKIEVGQPARLYVNAFPHMEYRIFEGKVTDVPAVPAMDGTLAGDAVYPVKVSIQDPKVSGPGRHYSLAYGMNVETTITVERGRIVELLWKKLLRATGKVGGHDLHLLREEESNRQTEHPQSSL